jgi:hypothetical protein
LPLTRYNYSSVADPETLTVSGSPFTQFTSQPTPAVEKVLITEERELNSYFINLYVCTILNKNVRIFLPSVAFGKHTLNVNQQRTKMHTKLANPFYTCTSVTCTLLCINLSPEFQFTKDVSIAHIPYNKTNFGCDHIRLKFQPLFSTEKLFVLGSVTVPNVHEMLAAMDNFPN